jgi:hypothetical protein
LKAICGSLTLAPMEESHRYASKQPLRNNPEGRPIAIIALACRMKLNQVAIWCGTADWAAMPQVVFFRPVDAVVAFRYSRVATMNCSLI